MLDDLLKREGVRRFAYQFGNLGLHGLHQRQHFGAGQQGGQLIFDNYPGLSPAVLQQIPPGETWMFHFSDASDPHSYIVRRIPYGGATIAYALVEFDLGGFTERIMPDGAALVIGSGQGVLYAAGTETAAPELFSAAARDGSFALGEHRYTAHLNALRLPGLQVLVGVATDQLAHMRRMYVAVMAAALVLLLGSMAALVYWLNRQLFGPVERLIETAQRQPTDAPAALRSIAQDLIDTKTANDAMQQERSRILPLALGRELGHLLEAVDTEESLLYARSALLLAGLDDGEGYAMFAVCCAEDRGGFFSDMRRDPRLNERVELFRFLLNNVLTDLLFQDYPGTVAPLRENWFLVVLSCGSAADAEQVEDIAQQLLETYEQTFHATLVVTRTLWGRTAEEFVYTLRATVQEIAYLDFWGREREQGEPGDSAVPDTFPQYRKLIRKLFARIDLQDYDSLPALLNELFDQTLPGGVEDIQIAKHRIYALAALILAGIDEQLGDVRDFAAAQNFEQRLYRADTMADFKKELSSILDELTAYKKQQDTAAATLSRMEEIKRYILDHYTENELTAASIAAEFQMSGSYLSRAFKECMGSNILDYIQRLRVDAAKPLLRTGSVREAAQQVGFWDTQGLVRAFKKHEGMTPSEYKRVQGEP